MMNKITILILLFLSGCENIKDKSKELELNNSALNKEIKSVLDDYIKANPLKFHRLKGKSIIESGFSYPSYHMFFNKKETDTIFSIVLFPNYNNFELEGVTNIEDETIYRSIKHKGWVMYKKKYPIIIFDYNNYSQKLIKSNYLLSKIADSLEAGNNFQHIKFVRWDYKLQKGKINRIDSIGVFHTHPEKDKNYLEPQRKLWFFYSIK